MAVASPAALSETPVARLAPTEPQRRAALLFGVIVVTSLAFVAFALYAFLEIPSDDRGLFTYSDIAPIRASLWTFHTVAGVTLIVGACAVALAAWLLVTGRGARWATIGGSLVWLGAAMHGVGAGSFAGTFYFATDPAVLNRTTAAALIDHINDDTLRTLAVPAAGALLVTLGSLLLAVALWRARCVPRWVPVVGAVSAIAGLLVAPASAAGPVAETASSITSIALGWYVWRRYAGSPQPQR